MNEEQYQLETIEHLIDALESAKIIAGARFEQECRNKSYVDAVFFESIRDRLASEIKVVKDYEDVTRVYGRRGRMTNQEKFIETFGIEAWKQMVVFSGMAEQFREFWTSPYKEGAAG